VKPRWYEAQPIDEWRTSSKLINGLREHFINILAIILFVGSTSSKYIYPIWKGGGWFLGYTGV
jgi:hypothetical protein